ncbi:ABC transporter permease [Aestuariibacter salexigens]|uniref:ABC transporter permease n=1 Tax=Aestuariibacter salexigens TaxID=226010 RepID=UPI000413EDC2|nr:FtsX-like permease family protein [Aestuariibacter salexigens]
MNFPLKFAYQDLSQSAARLWLFSACLVFGVCLVMAATTMYQMLDRVMLSDTRVLMGGDVEVESRQAIEESVLEWVRTTGDISLTRELDTMMSTQDDEFVLVELLSTDSNYPLYGELVLEPAQTLGSALQKVNGMWGVAIDPVLAERVNLAVGDKVFIGELEVVIRALVLEQPDRRLSADWRGAPVLIAEQAMDESGLIREGSRVEYEYRIRTEQDVASWEENFIAQFPDTEWEIQTFEDRSRRIADRLSQIASGLLIVAFSTLFIGGLGVFNSVSVYLQSKRSTIATLKACGLRDVRIGQVYITEIAILAAASGLIGVVVGSGLAIIASNILAQDIAVALNISDVLTAGAASWLFGMITAFTFASPALGRALNVDVAHLFRATEVTNETPSVGWRLISLLCAVVLILFVLIAIPNLLFGLAFVVTVGLCLVLFEGVVTGLRWLSKNLERRPWLYRHAAIRLALSNMHRPGTPLRITLLSLGTALTLVVACSVIVIALLRLVSTTIPEESPALVLYDVLGAQKSDVERIAKTFPSLSQLTLTPNVRGRVSSINNVPIRNIEDNNIDWQDMARDEHKLSYLAGNIDGIRLVEGSMWDAGFDSGSRPIADVDFAFIMEDREAGQMQLSPGDTLTFTIEGISRTGLLTGIYSQKGIQTRFWFEAIVSEGALDDFINAYVGTAYMTDEDALTLQMQLAKTYPNIITERTKDLIDSASTLLDKGTNGLIAISSVSLLVSLMVLASVMAAGRSKQSYHAIILYCIGARISYIRRAIAIEYALLATIVSAFSILLGLSIAWLVLHLRLKIFVLDVYWIGVAVAVVSSALVFGAGAVYLFKQLTIQPARLLKETA